MSQAIRDLVKKDSKAWSSYSSRATNFTLLKTKCGTCVLFHITWYGASSKSNTEYQVQGPSPTVKTKFGHNSRGSQGFTEVNANGFRI